MATLAETIREHTRKHLLENNGLLYAQCVRAVGWIGGTVPELTEEQGIVELPTSDASNGGIVCGAALVGRMPIYVVRYQGFMWYNAVSILNYAAKSMEMWDQPCPVFVRAIGMDGGIGPVASNMNHSIMAHMPGIDVYAPMTSREWTYVWESFLANPRPIYCSEHRISFNKTGDLYGFERCGAQEDINLIYIGPSRFEDEEVGKQLNKLGIIYNSDHIFDLSRPEDQLTRLLKRNGPVLVIDDDYIKCGIAEHIAAIYDGYSLGLQTKTAGFAKHTDNLYPKADDIVAKVLEII